MKVYRIENERGQGPYTGANQYEWRTRSHATSKTPNPYEEGLNMKSSERCGFKSLVAAKKWFSCKTELKRLHKMGFALYVFNVAQKKVRTGKKQLLFIRPKRRKLYKQLNKL